MGLRRYIAGGVVGGALVLHGPCVMANSLSSELSGAFHRLDVLASELDGRLRELGVPREANEPELPLQDDACLAGVLGRAPGDTRAMPMSCVSRSQMAARIGDLEARFEEHAKTIVEINGEIPALREGVVTVRGCTEELDRKMATAVVRLEGLDIGTDCRAIAELGPCMDRLREDTEDRLKRATTATAIRRLAGELKQLTSMNERAVAAEQAIYRGVSKRRRLLQELREFARELEQTEDACG